MGHKIFVSYKYADSDVKQISDNTNEPDTVRNYVDKLEEYLQDASDHIYKGESDGVDLSNLSDDTIWEKLKDRIYDSSLTIVMISKNMKDPGKSDRDQWIPWEISYSLKEISRKNSSGDAVTSRTNAMLAIVIPDINNDYEYYIRNKSCCVSGCRFLQTDKLFTILGRNMFNVKNPNKKHCDDGSIVYYDEHSYIISVKWDDFIADVDKYIDRAYSLQDKIADFNIYKDVE